MADHYKAQYAIAKVKRGNSDHSLKFSRVQLMNYACKRLLIEVLCMYLLPEKTSLKSPLYV